MVHGKNRIPYWIDRRLTGLVGPEYHAIISFGLPIEPEGSQYGEYRSSSVCSQFTGHSKVRLLVYEDEGLCWIPSIAMAIPSTIENVNADKYANAHLPLPPLPEQRAIIRYLDHVDERIRRYISTKEKLIALLEEERQAVIHRAVTRGLDPNVPLKPSGVEWLGDVPAHWEVTALHHKYSQSLGKMLDSKRIMGDHLLPYLRNTDIQWDRINVDNLPTMDIPPSEYDRYTVRPGDLLVCEGGEVGRSALWSGELTICGFQKALHRLRPRREDVPRFMYYVLRSASNRNVFSDGHVSTIAHLTGDKLRAHRFPFPSLPEQTAIVEHLDKCHRRHRRRHRPRPPPDRAPPRVPHAPHRRRGHRQARRPRDGRQPPGGSRSVTPART